MATLTDTDFIKIRTWLRAQPTRQLEMNTWSLSKTQWKAAFQACETYIVNAFTTVPSTSIKAAIEVATGPTTVVRARTIFECYVGWKIREIQGT